MPLLCAMLRVEMFAPSEQSPGAGHGSDFTTRYSFKCVAVLTALRNCASSGSPLLLRRSKHINLPESAFFGVACESTQPYLKSSSTRRFFPEKRTFSTRYFSSAYTFCTRRRRRGGSACIRGHISCIARYTAAVRSRRRRGPTPAFPSLTAGAWVSPLLCRRRE